MKGKAQILLGASDEFEDYVRGRRQVVWPCGKEIRKSDRLFIYFEKPDSAIKAAGVALKDAAPGKRWDYQTRFNVRILAAPITIDEMREMFPTWRWLERPQGRPYLDADKRDIAERLWKRSKAPLTVAPVAMRVSGGGFGSYVQNRLVEQAACKEVCRHFKSKGYEVTSREQEHIGYDFDVCRGRDELHVEVKGVSGSQLRFPITANEVGRARSDRNFRLAVVTEATKSKRRVYVFRGKEFSKGFRRTALAYIAEATGSL